MSSKIKLNKTHLIIFIFILLFLIPIVLIVAGSKPSTFSDTIIPSPVNTTSTQTPANIVAVKMVPDDVNWAAGETYEVTAQFDETLEITPDYSEVIFIYDPEVLTLNDIEPGNLWTEQNVLIKTINNEEGTAKLVFGKAVGSQTTKLNKIATLTFSVLDTSAGNTAIVLDPDSNAASSVSEGLIKLSAKPLILTIGQ